MIGPIQLAECLYVTLWSAIKLPDVIVFTGSKECGYGLIIGRN
jgi:hypothetical protein